MNPDKAIAICKTLCLSFNSDIIDRMPEKKLKEFMKILIINCKDAIDEFSKEEKIDERT